jgi:hypothetical protein
MLGVADVQLIPHKHSETDSQIEFLTVSMLMESLKAQSMISPSDWRTLGERSCAWCDVVNLSSLLVGELV